MNEVDKAMQDAEAALKVTPLNTAALYLRSQLRFRQGDVRGTVDDLKAAIKVDQNSAGLHADLANVQRGRGNNQESDAEYLRAAVLLYWKLADLKNQPNPPNLPWERFTPGFQAWERNQNGIGAAGVRNFDRAIAEFSEALNVAQE